MALTLRVPANRITAISYGERSVTVNTALRPGQPSTLVDDTSQPLLDAGANYSVLG